MDYLRNSTWTNWGTKRNLIHSNNQGKGKWCSQASETGGIMVFSLPGSASPWWSPLSSVIHLPQVLQPNYHSSCPHSFSTREGLSRTHIPEKLGTLWLLGTESAPVIVSRKILTYDWQPLPGSFVVVEEGKWWYYKIRGAASTSWGVGLWDCWGKWTIYIYTEVALVSPCPSLCSDFPVFSPHDDGEVMCLP